MYKSKDFDTFYSDRTEPLKTQLAEFRQNHIPKVVFSGGSRWEYLDSGHCDEVILVLHGGGGPAESLFRYIASFEKRYRVIAPTVPASVSTVEEVLTCIKEILEKEKVPRVHLFGVSNGGMIGQCLLRRAPLKVQTLILFHSMLPSQEYAKQFSRRVRTLSRMPLGVTATLGRYWLNKQIREEARLAAPDEQVFWIAYFRELYASELITKEYFVSRAKILTDYFGNYQFSLGDLDEWPGKILIIESENDRVVNDAERKRLKRFYRQAKVHTFRGVGHLGGGLFKVEETTNLVDDYLRSASINHQY